MGRIVAVYGIRGLVQAFDQRYRQHRRDVRLLPLPKRSAETQSTKIAH